MKPRASHAFASRNRRRGSVFIIVMWTCLGLVALTLYFANSMSSELRAADNRVTEIEARQAVAGGIRYASYVLTTYAINGAMPNPNDYKSEALPVGDAQFWFLGRDYGLNATISTPQPTDPVYGLIDESSKLNLNTATRAMLLELPNMTDELADSIIAWKRPSTSQTAATGNYDNVYSSLTPPRLNKGGNFETIDELRLVDGMTLDILFGEDTNRNGVLDPNEDDGEQSAPRDNQNGLLDAGLLEYVTVYSRQPNTKADGSRRLSVLTPTGGAQAVQQFVTQLRNLLLARGIDGQRVATIAARFNDPANPPPINSVAAFMVRSQMTAEEYALIHADVTHVATGATVPGLVNVNTASAAVLACIPGIGLDAPTLVAYRQAHPDLLTSFQWLTQVLTPANITRAGPYITDQSYQFTADIAAVGHYGRGYSREKVVFDMSNRTPRIVYHQDLTSYGWALGSQVRQTLKGEAQ
jgi:type II secretory pathway component PulK